MQKNLPALCKKIRLLVLCLLFLFIGGAGPGSQETEEEIPREELIPPETEISGEAMSEELNPEEFEEEAIPEWTPPSYARWFRSNKGGMTLEEIPSRLAALRNDYALVIDYISPAELPVLLVPFYQRSYAIEIRVLYFKEEESRRQWVFRDGKGVTRLVAVFSGNLIDSLPEAVADEAAAGEAAGIENAAETAETAGVEDESPPDETAGIENAADSAESGAESADAETAPTGNAPIGFIEIYNEDYHITGEHLFSEEGEETITEYFYNRGTLIRGEAVRKTSNEEGQEELQKTYTDNYRYNRSGSLRSVERVFHERVEAEPVNLRFPNRILDAAADENFIGSKLSLGSSFFGEYVMEPGFRMEYTTDDRGRILTQTLIDAQDQTIWTLKNTWSGERIAAAYWTDEINERLTEYEYNGDGDRIIERNFNNGILERLVRTDGAREVEELYMNETVILRAVWEDGRKISEERIRSR
jgi:hypothetical protein